jgi:hypothetical protein
MQTHTTQEAVVVSSMSRRRCILGLLLRLIMYILPLVASSAPEANAANHDRLRRAPMPTPLAPPVVNQSDTDAAVPTTTTPLLRGGVGSLDDTSKQQTTVSAFVNSPRYRRPPFEGGGGEHLLN